MRNLVAVILVLLIISCNGRKISENEFDKIIVTFSRCRPIFTDTTGVFFEYCPATSCLIDSKLNYFKTEYRPFKKKSDCYRGHISETFYHNLFANMLDTIYTDSIRYDLQKYLNSGRLNEITSYTQFPTNMILLLKDTVIVQVIITERYDGYQQIVDTIFNYSDTSKLLKMSDTSLIDLHKYLWLPSFKGVFKQRIPIN